MKKRKKVQEMTIDALNRKARQQIIAILAAGVLLMAVDLAMSSGEEIKIIESYGQLYMIRPEAGEETGAVTLKAEIQGEAQTYEKQINVMLEPYGSNDKQQEDTAKEDSMNLSQEERFDYELRTMADGFNSDITEKKIRLPDSLDSGERIEWEVREKTQQDYLIIIMLLMIVSAAVYKNRLSPLKKRRQENMESVTRQLPEFVNRLVLLLNAGLVLSAAFEKAVEESMAFQNRKEEYFHMKMKEIYVTVKTANGSMNREIRRFARESGSRELMRIANIINDNISKGVELTQKLQNESELLWMNRKKNCEEKGRLAETKLTMPLVIFLMALILITVAPALLEL